MTNAYEWNRRIHTYVLSCVESGYEDKIIIIQHLMEKEREHSEIKLRLKPIPHCTVIQIIKIPCKINSYTIYFISYESEGKD